LNYNDEQHPDDAHDEADDHARPGAVGVLLGHRHVTSTHRIVGLRGTTQQYDDDNVFK